MKTESPLSWLASRRGRDGRALEAHQLEAGERLRADFTRANLMPRITSDWSNPSSAGRRAQGRRTGGPSDRYDSCLATARTSGAGCRRSRIRGVIGRRLLLKGLEAIERERAWPSRSGKVVLQLALDRLARHYGYAARARGPARSQLRAWSGRWRRFRLIAANYAASAKAALASARMRSTIERNPFERCGVRFSLRPMRSNSARESIVRMSRALLPE
jgi:hypothetical protein